MPIVVNSNVSATEASFNLSRANDSLRKSLTRLSSGKRINSPADDAGGLAVAYKLDSKLNRTEAVIQNSQNALSFLQVQDGALRTVGKILDRMAELRTMAQDVTKNSGDIENYSKESSEQGDEPVAIAAKWTTICPRVHLDKRATNVDLWGPEGSPDHQNQPFPRKNYFATPSPPIRLKP